MNIFLCISLLAVFFAILPLCLLFILKNKKHLKIAYVILLFLYIVVICIGVFCDVKIKKVITIKSYTIPPNAEKFFNFKLFTKNKKDIFLNLCMFVPFGFLLTALFNKLKLLKSLLCGSMFSIFIEVTQYFLPTVRTAQMSDIILNTASCLIGSLIFISFYCLKNKIQKKEKTT